MRYHIEHAKFQYDRITVTGWLAGDTAQAETQIWAEDGRGRRVPCQVDRTLREDVTRALFGAVESGCLGFRIRWDAEEGKKYALCFSDGKQTKRCKTDGAQIRKYRRIPDDLKDVLKLQLGKEKIGVPLSQVLRPGSVSGESKFSIVTPVYNTEPEHLADMLTSIWKQTYGNWEICLADGSPVSLKEKLAVGEDTVSQILTQYLSDPRVKYIHLSENLGISGNTNAALKLAEGDFVVMVDHDDVLEVNALELVAQVIAEHPGADFIYSHSDLTDHDNLYNYNPLLKPRWSLEMLYSANYITHLSVVRTSLLRELGGWKKEYDGAQDWDLFLRIGEATREIYRIPEILYHWRAADSSTARDVGTKPYARLAQLRAVQDHLDRRGLPGKAQFVEEKSTCIRVVWDPEFLDSVTEEDVILWAAPGVEISEESAAELGAWAIQPDMGIIAPRVVDSQGKIVSQGYTIGDSMVAVCSGMMPGTAGMGGHTDWYHDHVVPEPLCFAVKRSLWQQLGGWGDREIELALIDLCLRAEKAGFRNMSTPFAQVVSDKEML